MSQYIQVYKNKKVCRQIWVFEIGVYNACEHPIVKRLFALDSLKIYQLAGFHGAPQIHPKNGFSYVTYCFWSFQHIGDS